LGGAALAQPINQSIAIEVVFALHHSLIHPQPRLCVRGEMTRKALRNEERPFQGRERKLGMSNKYWNSLPWKPVDLKDENLGSFDDSVFFGLEEIDGNAFVSSNATSKPQPTIMDDEMPAEAVVDPKKPKKNSKKRNAAAAVAATEEADFTVETDGGEKVNTQAKKTKKRALAAVEEPLVVDGETGAKTTKSSKKLQKLLYSNPVDEDAKAASTTVMEKPVATQSDEDALLEKKRLKKQKKREEENKRRKENRKKKTPQAVRVVPDENAIVLQLQQKKTWGGLSLSSPLSEALKALDFSTPTPIQKQTLPIVSEAKCDVVGVAETGSGKTLVSASQEIRCTCVVDDAV
jgi:hypothetical protein